jgi:hypothetical protein
MTFVAVLGRCARYSWICKMLKQIRASLVALGGMESGEYTIALHGKRVSIFFPYGILQTILKNYGILQKIYTNKKTKY